jgi:amino acid adenylation domain-containing protein
VLGIDEIGVRDNFFDLGGHSLRATQIASRIRDTFGIEIPLAVIFAQVTIADLAPVVEAYRRNADTGVVRQSIPVAPRDRPLPLSFSQERVWFLQQLEPESLAYNFQTLMYFTGPLDVEALRASLNSLIDRHEILRTSFSDVGGVPAQHIHPPFVVDLPVVDLRELPLALRDGALKQRIDAETSRAFDMSRLPLIRWTLFRLGDDKFAMLHIEHHLIHDGWSFNVLRRELLQLYLAHAGGVAPALEPAPIQFADYAVWQRNWMTGEVLQTQLDYWKRQLADAPTLELPTDRARPLAQTFKGSVHEITLSGELYAALRSLSDELGTTLFITLETAFFVLLHRYSSSDDVSIGSGVANRRWTETEGLLGMLVNNVVLRSVLRGNPSFRSFASDVGRTTLDAFANQDAPFDHVVRAVGPRVDSSRNPLFQVMFSFHDSPLDEPALPGIDFQCVELLSNRSAKFDLNVVVVPHAEQRLRRDQASGPDGITLFWEYNTALFDAATVEQMAVHYRTLLKSVTSSPQTSVLELEMLDQAERHAILIDRNRTRVPYPAGLTIHARFEEQAARTPDAIAVVSGNIRLSYRELDVRANQLAHRLRDEGVSPGVTVGVCLDRSIEMLVGVLGILKAGGAYVPMDPGYPDDRLLFIGQETRIALLLTDCGTQDRCAAWGWPAMNLTELEKSSGCPISQPDAVAGPMDVAYVMFTSGSTGRPKGVAVPHRGVLRLLFGVDYVQLGAHRRILHMAPLSFDSSNFEIWGALLHGGTCVVRAGDVPTPKELGDVLRTHEIDTLWLTSSMFNAVIDDAPEALTGVRQLLVGGEALSVPHVRRAQAALPNTTIVNGYGPTESTTFTCCHRLTEPLDASSRSVPIGRPIGNTTVYLLDRCLTPVPIGVAGELYIAGDGLAHGYAGQPALTAERFLPDPYGPPGSRMYWTGDFARYRRDGLIEFVGRTDDQVKIRGYRIELGEIENVLRQHAAVRDAAVVVRDDLPGGRTLVAYVVAAAGTVLEIDAVRDHLRLTLPVYMIPARFVLLDALPLSPTGKVSRRLLPAPSAGGAELPRPSVPATTDVEQAVAGVWRDVLKLEHVSADDNFFDLGGHSLLATRIVAMLREELLVDLPLRALFEHPTVAGLARRITVEVSNRFRDERGPSPWRYLFPLNSHGDGSPIFMLPGGQGGDYEFLVYARLVHFVGDGFTFYGLRARSADGVEPAHASVKEMARDYIAEMRAVQPDGPYRLVGNCIGGVVAYEMARQLERAGQQVRTLVLMDTEFPTRSRHLRDLWTRTHGNLRYYRRRLVHHSRAMLSIPWRHRWSYLFGRARAAITEAPVTGYVNNPAKSVKVSYMDTLRRYRPRAYHGPVSIIASQQDESDPTAGWANVVRGEIAVHSVPGDHNSYIRDHVKETAMQLKVCLEE